MAELVIAHWQPEPAVALHARLLSLPKSRMRPVENGRVVWTDLAVEDITPFVVVTVSSEGRVRNVLVRANIHGDPDDRRKAVIARAIRSREDFMRYLAALLGYDAFGLGGVGGEEGGFDAWCTGVGVDRVLEDLLTTASRAPERLASLGHTLDALSRDPRFDAIVPPDFKQLWDAVHASRKTVIA